ncbi:MAG: hypothetical protein Ct9H300mP2_2600 [Candidatus Neomarinimicrobiota bacterium]|nr:MAG: hypothetical protein Ct9H300mP2_2600 [Candidatus Neomarinimicrobiota bacterium]
MGSPPKYRCRKSCICWTNATATESGDIVLDEVRAMVFSDGEMSELEADPEEAIAATIIDISQGRSRLTA